MSDIKIKVTKETLQSYLDKTLVMRRKAELYVEEYNREVSEKKELHERKLRELIGDRPKDRYREEYEETQDIEEVSFVEDKERPWWMFWKDIPLKCITKKVPVKFSFVIISDFNQKNWEEERDNVTEYLSSYKFQSLCMLDRVHKDISDLTKAIAEASDDIEVDPEYLVDLENTYDVLDNLYSYHVSPWYCFGSRRYLVDYSPETLIDINNGCFISHVVIRLGAALLSSKDKILLDKVKEVSKFHNEVRTTPRGIAEMLKEAGLDE